MKTVLVQQQYNLLMGNVDEVSRNLIIQSYDTIMDVVTEHGINNIQLKYEEPGAEKATVINATDPRAQRILAISLYVKSSKEGYSPEQETVIKGKLHMPNYSRLLVEISKENIYSRGWQYETFDEVKEAFRRQAKGLLL